jgi:hypothetical protein
MIWLRRTVAVPLALIFIILSIVLLVVFRVDGTLANAGFYHDQLHQADMYNFVYEEALPAALEEAGIGGEVAGIELEPHLIALAEQTLPREWLQVQVEEAISQVVPYLWGAREGFDINIPLQDRVEAGSRALKDILHNDELFLSLYDRVIDLILDEVGEGQGMPAFLVLERDETARVLRRVLPPDWVRAQLEAAIDEVTPYFTGQKDDFMVRVDIAERLPALESALVDILRSPEAYDYLFLEAALPVVRQNLSASDQLPLGVSLTDEEILGVVKDTLPLQWYQSQVSVIVGQLFAYLGGEEETLEVVVSLADRKPAIASALGDLADRKLEGLIDSLPVCTAGQLVDLFLNPPLDRPPDCRPLDVTYQELKDLLGVDVGVLMAPFIDLWVPDEWVITGAELNAAFGGEEDILAQIKELLREGLTYSEADLRAQLGTDHETVTEIRQWLATGLTFSEADLRDQLGDDGVQTLDGVRKLLWAAAVLALMAIIAYILFGPVFSATAQPRIDEALALAGQAEGFEGLMAAKGVTIAQNAITSFIGGLKALTLGLFIASLAIIGGGVFWYIREREEE